METKREGGAEKTREKKETLRRSGKGRVKYRFPERNSGPSLHLRTTVHFKMITTYLKIIISIKACLALNNNLIFKYYNRSIHSNA